MLSSFGQWVVCFGHEVLNFQVLTFYANNCSLLPLSQPDESECVFVYKTGKMGEIMSSLVKERNT